MCTLKYGWIYSRKLYVLTVHCTVRVLFLIYTTEKKFYKMWCKSRKLGTSHNMLARRSWKTFVKFCLISSISWYSIFYYQILKAANYSSAKLTKYFNYAKPLALKLFGVPSRLGTCPRANKNDESVPPSRSPKLWMNPQSIAVSDQKYLDCPTF